MAFLDFLSNLLKASSEKEKNLEFDVEQYNKNNQAFIDSFCRRFDLSTKDGIRSIPRSCGAKFHKETDWNAVIVPEAILSKKATEYKKNGNMELAIECLYKSNELKQVSIYEYAPKDYLRLATYLRNASRFDDARKVEAEIGSVFGQEAGDAQYHINESDSLKRSMEEAKLFHTDLLEASWVGACCETCGKYRGRIFSISGTSKRYPKLPDDFHFGCGLSLFAFNSGVSKPAYLTARQLTAPFKDTRTQQEKAAYSTNVQKAKEDAEAKREFEWIQEHLPELAPKSKAGYRRMKNSRSANYLKIQAAAKEKGFEIQ